MAKVVQFQPLLIPVPFGPLRVGKKKEDEQEKQGQLNLFKGGKVVSLLQHNTFDEASLLEESGYIENAKERYLQSIEKQESVADSYCNLGILEYQQKNLAKAADYFTLCLKEDPRHFESHYNLANLYSELGNLPLAKVHFQIAIEIEPSFTNSYFNLALTLALNKEVDEAISMLQRYCQLVPKEEQTVALELINKLTP